MDGTPEKSTVMRDDCCGSKYGSTNTVAVSTRLALIRFTFVLAVIVIGLLPILLLLLLSEADAKPSLSVFSRFTRMATGAVLLRLWAISFQASPNSLEATNNNITTSDTDDVEEDETNHYYKEGLYQGYFRKTEKNDCTINNTTCVGHIIDYPCGWR